YPLSYEGASHQGTCQRLSAGVSNGYRLSAATAPTGERTPSTPAVVILLDDHERASSLSAVHRRSPTTARTSFARAKIIDGYRNGARLGGVVAGASTFDR
ncbi:MAG TPA: hypothetical protein VHN18_03490, partial [Micromonosporaceae bacterium]|nr:hypothetical protein [Micromonosporaceae bacterium]